MSNTTLRILSVKGGGYLVTPFSLRGVPPSQILQLTDWVGESDKVPPKSVTFNFDQNQVFF